MEANAQALHALLYAHGGEMKKEDIVTALYISHEDLKQLQENLTHMLHNQGLELFETEHTLSLRTARAYADFIAQLQQKDADRDIGSAGLEVLSIVLYKGEASRTTIDYIRGVNSSGTLRQLVLRGLLERTRDSSDARAWVYTPTPELLSHLNITSLSELPDFDTIRKQLDDPTAINEHESV